MFEIVGGNPYLTQWELNRTVSNPCMKVNDEVVFVNSSGRTCVTYARMQDGQVVADVPNILLQDARNILGTLGQSLEKHSECETAFEVHEAEKPEGYVYVDNIKLPDNEQGGSSGGSGGVDVEQVEATFLSYGNDVSAENVLRLILYRNTKITKMRSCAFYNNPAKEIDLPNLTFAARQAFAECDVLVKANLPQLSNSEEGIFSFCVRLAEVNVPKLQDVEVATFADCRSLERIELPMAFVIRSAAFENCESLKAVILGNTNEVCEILSIDAFNNTPMMTGEGHIYVHSVMYEYYRAGYESTLNQIMPGFFDILFRKIEDYPEICG